MSPVDDRPDPDELLARVQRDDARGRRGRLMIFFGAAAGVGKTFAMLRAASALRAAGEDVVVGLVETHGREETRALLEGLEILPPREVPHRGATLREFDLDGALLRHPALVLVDELAHTNAPGSRHARRWQDVEELLDAGVDVYTTLNVQHLESVSDVVGSITGIRVFETVPDTFFEQADEVELVDLPPDELLERLRDGKVYLPEAAERAMANFFRKGNLMALRELALRRTAERVDAQMRDYRDDQSIRSVWPVGERILVCLSPGSRGEQLVRAGRRLSTSLRAPWIVAYIETPRLQRLPPAERDQVMETLRLAEELGAETTARSGQTISEEVLDIVRSRNVTKVVMGQPTRRGWRRWLLGSVVDAVARGGRDFDLYLVGGGQAGQAGEPVRAAPRRELDADEGDGRRRLDGYLSGAGITLACTAIAWLMRDAFEVANLIMVYLVGVVYVAARHGRGPSVLVSVLSVLVFDFCFVPPYFTFAVSDTQYVVTFAVMLLVSLVISRLTTGVRSQARVAGYRERRAAALYDFSRALVASHDEREIVSFAVRRIAEEFQSPSVILLPDAGGRVRYPPGPATDTALRGADLSVAQWVFDHAERAGQGTDTLPAAAATYFPIRGPSGTVGVLAIRAVNLRRIFLPEQQRLLETFLAQAAQAVERVRLAEKAKATEMQVEAESLRNALLSAISHDLRTPLAAIVGSASGLVEDRGQLTPEARGELARAVYDEGQRMASLTSNILDMARLETGAVRLDRQWTPLEEIVGAVLRRLRQRLDGRPVRVDLPADLPLINVDGALLEQVLVNLLENAAKYTPAGSPVEISARVAVGGGALGVSVADRGPGIPAGEAERLFEKFYRAHGDRERAQSGVGLGLTICRAIVHAHGGAIRAENRPGGGALFTFTLPLDEAPPGVEPEDERAAGADAS
jgi:two-component system sensor histidine kinase KdpD